MKFSLARALALVAICSCNKPLAFSTTTVPALPPAIQINEVLPSNATGIVDELDQHPDWVELYNPTDAAVALDGFVLTSDEGSVAVPDGHVIEAGGTLLLFADADVGPGHIDLRLSRDGERLTLSAPDGTELDRITWGPLIPDHSLARSPDGGADWQVRSAPTPGEANGGEAFGVDPAADCTLEGSIPELHALEGDSVQISASCAESGDWRYQWFGSWTGTDSALTRNLGLADAGEYEVLVSAKQADAAGIPETAVFRVSVADDWTHPENIPVDPGTYLAEWGLPVLHLDADPTAIPQTYVPTGAWLDGVEYTAQIKVRGAASAGFPKNNFTIEFDPLQADFRPYGLSKKDHLVLVSNFDDNSHVRQRLVYDTWAAMAEAAGEPRLTPRSHPVVLYMNGAYHGLYLALDHVDDEFLREIGVDSGGDLYKSVTHDANFYLHDASGNGKGNLALGWEKKEGLDPYDFSSIADLTAWTGASTHQEVAAGLESRLPTAEFMDWFHLVYVFAADDSAAKNAYLYQDPADGRFRYVPWDFNHALGQTWQTARQSPDGLSDYVWNNAIFWHIQQEPGLAAAHWARLDALRQPGAPLSPEAQIGLLATYDAQLGGHPDRDWERWRDPYFVYGLWSWRTDWTTPAEERAYVEAWIEARALAIDAVP